MKRGRRGNRGRPPKGSELVTKFEGSEEAKERLKVIVGTLTGELTMEEACGHLGVGEGRLHQMRDEVLQIGLAALEPKPVGRPRNEESEGEKKVRELEARVERLKLELHAADVRTMLALTMPKVLNVPWAREPDVAAEKPEAPATLGSPETSEATGEEKKRR